LQFGAASREGKGCSLLGRNERKDFHPSSGGVKEEKKETQM